MKDKHHPKFIPPKGTSKRENTKNIHQLQPGPCPPCLGPSHLRTSHRFSAASGSLSVPSSFCSSSSDVRFGAVGAGKKKHLKGSREREDGQLHGILCSVFAKWSCRGHPVFVRVYSPPFWEANLLSSCGLGKWRPNISSSPGTRPPIPRTLGRTPTAPVGLFGGHLTLQGLGLVAPRQVGALCSGGCAVFRWAGGV